MSSDDRKGNEELTIFRQYIHDIPTHGIDFNLLQFTQIDYILSFAIEHYDKHGKGDGCFTPTWKVDPESIEMVKKLKEDHPEDYPEVRVVISIGGVGEKFPFNPAEKDIWIFNAVKTIEKIIHLYDDNRSYKTIIDGIDIHYDVINSSEDDFSYCIGEVIKKLKSFRSLSVVSIAPTKLVESYYLKLYQANIRIIDLVDYQFYNQKFSSKEQVIELYKKLVIDYSPAKVLAGITDPVDAILYEGIKYLIKHKLLPGIFFWNFEDSLEKFLQDLLAT
ncbi:hypothetical protein RYX36_025286 [Vicia faba]